MATNCENRERIRKHKVFLVETLCEDADVILQHTHQEKLITGREYRNLKDVGNREKLTIDLLDKLMSKGEDTCCKFVQILRLDNILETFPSLVGHVIIARPGPESLEEVFKWLGFNVVIHKDKTTSQIKDLLTDLGKTVNGDCFICCVLSHGKSEGVYGTDDNLVSVDEIREPFNGSNCRNLAGKPKLFFIQACRGGKNQKLVYVQADDPEEAEPELEVDAHRVEVSIPADSDFLIARSTIDGHFSYRSTKKGSWFIQSLCQQLKTHCPQGTDIQTILLAVNNEVSQEGFTSKQMPVHEVAMRNKLILHVPGAQ